MKSLYQFQFQVQDGYKKVLLQILCQIRSKSLSACFLHFGQSVNHCIVHNLISKSLVLKEFAFLMIVFPNLYGCRGVTQFIFGLSRCCAHFITLVKIPSSTYLEIHHVFHKCELLLDIDFPKLVGKAVKSPYARYILPSQAIFCSLRCMMII